ncbi:tRNA threonylcarbamoyladenosine dehydratase [Clostridium sp. DL1XJH146]
MEVWLQRTVALIGEEKVNLLSEKKVVILGIGGVGSFTCESIARAGIGNIVLVDKDIIDITNINRQIIATSKTVGKSKVETMKERILDINPKCNVEIHKVFIEKSNFSEIIKGKVDYVIDAIDTITSKIELAVWCDNNNIKLISSMGTGNKLDPTKFKVDDIYKTKTCPLAKVMRRELKKRQIKKLKVVFSEEQPLKPNFKEEELSDYNIRKKSTPASISFVPSVAGLIIAGEVIKDLIEMS